jgi:hypothetical protein
VTGAILVFKGGAYRCEDASLPGSDFFFVDGDSKIDRMKVKVMTDVGVL